MNNKDRKQIKEALEDSKKGVEECSDADNFNDSLIYEGWVEALEFVLAIDFTTKIQNENTHKSNKRKKKRTLLSGRQQTRRSKTSR
jgi:hypothetical protein